jgi:hypothetical protein
MFYDRYERRAYLRAIEVAKRIVDEPEVVKNAAQFLEEYVRPDPHQAGIYRLWKEMIALSPESIALALLEDSERGAELRGSAPVFVVLREGWQEQALQHLP